MPSAENNIYKEMFADPEPHDENDPAYKLEQFKTMKYMGWEPESLIDPKEAAEYREWLNNSSD